MRPRLVAVAGLVALAAPVASAAGCGSSSGGSPQPAAPDAAITIEAPGDGRRLKAVQSKGGLLRARARVRGRARPGSRVVVSAGCRPAACRAAARAGADGRWSATLTLAVPRAVRFVAIGAGTRPVVVVPGAGVATVELVGPARGRAKRRPARSAAAASAAAARARTRRRALPRDVLVIGDSLAVGMAEPLRAALDGWRVRIDARIGRPLDEGMGTFAREASPPAILAFSLFTNDDPRNTRALEAAVRWTATREGGCAVWATIVRPPEAGVGYGAANRLLRGLASDPELARGLQLVDWAALVARSPSLVSSDAVHASPQGYRVMGLAYAAAIRACAGER